MAGGAPVGPRRPSRRPQPGRRPSRPPGTPGPESPPGRPPCPAGRRASLLGGDLVAQPGVSRNRPVPSPAGPRRAPFPGSLSNFPGRGAGPGASAAPARRGSRSKQQQMRRARDLTVPVGSLGPGVPGGAAGRLGRCPPPSAPGHPVLAGAERMEWAAGPEETASSHPPSLPTSPPRRRSNFTKSEISRPPRGWRHPDGAGPAPGGLARANFGRPWALRAGWRGRPSSFRGLTFVRARAASAARPPTRVFCNQSVRLIKGGATAS